MELRFYIVRRVLVLIPTLLGLTLLMFLLEAMIPPALLEIPYFNPKSGISRTIQLHNAAILLGLNLPLPLRYFKYVWLILHGDLGVMNLAGYPGSVTLAIEQAFPNTIQLALFCGCCFVVLNELQPTCPGLGTGEIYSHGNFN